VDLFCDNNRNKLVALPTRMDSIEFRSNPAWSDAVKLWTQGVSTHVFDNVGTYIIPPNQDGQLIGQSRSTAGDWGLTEVVIYGTTDAIDWPAAEIRTKAKITGAFQTNPGSEEAGVNIPFLINTSGNWCVRLILWSWPIQRVMPSGFSGRSFKFHIDGMVARKYYPAGQKGKLWWGNPNGKQYLTKIYGIRIANVNHLSHSMTSETMGGREVAQLGDEGTYCVYDERWQNENPCFVPWYGLNMGNAEALAYQWARDSSGLQQGEVYTTETVNLQKVTYDSLDPKRND